MNVARTLRTPVSIGLDIGSTNSKVVAVNPDGQVLDRATLPTPRGADGSIDPRELLATLEAEVIGLAHGRFSVAAIASAGVGEDGFLADPQLAPQTLAMPWFDPRRAVALAGVEGLSWLDREVPIGVELDAARTVAAWAWLRANAVTTPDAVWVSVTDYPLAAWTGILFLTDNLAARSAAWSPWERRWLPARVERTLGATGALPPVLAAGSTLGPVTAPSLAPVLAPGAVAVNAGHDHPVAGWAVDRAASGAVLDSMGTAEVVVRQVRGMPPNRPDGIDVSPGIGHPGATLLAVHELARNIGWIRETRPELAFHLPALLATETLPHVPDEPVFEFGTQGGAAPRWLPAADRLAPREAALAALFACARAAVPTIQRLRAWDETAPAPPVMAAGGWSRSPGWVSLKERALGTRLDLVAEPEVTAVGAALVAGAAIGWSQDAARALRIAQEPT